MHLEGGDETSSGQNGTDAERGLVGGTSVSRRSDWATRCQSSFRLCNDVIELTMCLLVECRHRFLLELVEHGSCSGMGSTELVA